MINKKKKDAEASGDQVAQELLTWDRVAAEVCAELFEPGGGGLLACPTARVIRAEHDLPALTEELKQGRFEVRPDAVALAVHRTPRGVVTTCVEPKVADLLEELPAELSALPEELRPTIETLESAGLIRYT